MGVLMFVLVLRDGSHKDIEAPSLLDAMREALRRDADLQIGGGPSRVMQHAEIRECLLLDRPGLFDEFYPGWKSPTAGEFRELLRLAELTGSKAGALVGVPSGKIRKWVGGDGEVPYAVWRLLTIYAGLVEAKVRPKSNEITN